MFGSFKTFLLGADLAEPIISEKSVNREVVLGTILVLLETVMADGTKTNQEFSHMVRSINRLFGYSDEKSGELIEIAELLIKDPERTKALIEEMVNTLKTEEKSLVIGFVWWLAGADKNLDDAHIAIKLRKILCLSLEQANWGVREVERMCGKSFD